MYLSKFWVSNMQAQESTTVTINSIPFFVTKKMMPLDIRITFKFGIGTTNTSSIWASLLDVKMLKNHKIKNSEVIKKNKKKRTTLICSQSLIFSIDLYKY